MLESSGIFRAANPAWTTILGWQPAEVIGKNYLAFIHPDDRPGTEGALDQALDAPLPTFENRYLHRDGSFRWISWTAASENGVVYATSRDVTQDKQAASELLAAQERSGEAKKLRQ